MTSDLDLVERSIIAPGQERDQAKEAELNREVDEWIAPQDRPLQIARTAEWGWAAWAHNACVYRAGTGDSTSYFGITGDIRRRTAEHLRVGRMITTGLCPTTSVFVLLTEVGLFPFRAVITNG